MHTKSILAGVLTAVALAIPAAASAVTIDSITVSTVSGHPQVYFPVPMNDFGLLGAPHEFHLSDGQTRTVGAGWYPYTNGTVTNQTIDHGTITYEFGSISNWGKGNGVLFFHSGDVYDRVSSTEWSEGTLVPTGPLLLKAELGSNTATISGMARILNNHPDGQNARPNFIHYSLAEGALAPFSATYTLLNGDTWRKDIFSQRFTYSMLGTISFAPARVPEPDSLALGCLAFGLLVARRRGQHQA